MTSMCAFQNTVTVVDCLWPEQSQMAGTVSVVAVCRHTDKLHKANEQLSVVLTAGHHAQQQAAEADLADTSTSEAGHQTAPCRKHGSGAPSPCDYDHEGPALKGADSAAPFSTPTTSSEVCASAVPATACPAEVASCVGASSVTKLTMSVAVRTGNTGSGVLRSNGAPTLAAGSAAGCVREATDAKLTPEQPSGAAPAPKPDISILASAVAASKLGLVDQLSHALTTCAAVAFAK